MGHTRLGRIPTTRAWREVVGLFARSERGDEPAANVELLASSTMRAAAGAVRAARSDDGIAFIFFFLTQLALAGRKSSLSASLARLGINLPPAATSLDLTTEVHRVLDEHFFAKAKKSDFAEIAQLALGETLATFLRSRPRDLFASAPEQLKSDLRELGTQNGFGQVSRQFFANLMSRLLGFYLSKIVGPGPGQNLIKNVDDLVAFNAELRGHSYQRALIVHDFAAKWFSKTEFERGIDPRNAKRFVAYALQKIESEFDHAASG
jgi:hypothetical protein